MATKRILFQLVLLVGGVLAVTLRQHTQISGETQSARLQALVIEETGTGSPQEKLTKKKGSPQEKLIIEKPNTETRDGPFIEDDAGAYMPDKIPDRSKILGQTLTEEQKKQFEDIISKSVFVGSEIQDFVTDTQSHEDNDVENDDANVYKTESTKGVKSKSLLDYPYAFKAPPVDIPKDKPKDKTPVDSITKPKPKDKKTSKLVSLKSSSSQEFRRANRKGRQEEKQDLSQKVTVTVTKNDCDYGTHSPAAFLGAGCTTRIYNADDNYACTDGDIDVLEECHKKSVFHAVAALKWMDDNAEDIVYEGSKAKSLVLRSCRFHGCNFFDKYFGNILMSREALRAKAATPACTAPNTMTSPGCWVGENLNKIREFTIDWKDRKKRLKQVYKNVNAVATAGVMRKADGAQVHASISMRCSPQVESPCDGVLSANAFTSGLGAADITACGHLLQWGHGIRTGWGYRPRCNIITHEMFHAYASADDHYQFYEGALPTTSRDHTLTVNNADSLGLFVRTVFVNSAAIVAAVDTTPYVAPGVGAGVAGL